MAAYQLRRCAQELANAERARLLRCVRPAALPAAQAPDPAAELARGQAAPALPGSAAAAQPGAGDDGRGAKRRRPADKHAEGGGDSPCAGGAGLRPVEADSCEVREGDCAHGGEEVRGGKRLRRLASTDTCGGGGTEHAAGGEGTLSAREERAVALLALAASGAPAQGPVRPAAAPRGTAGSAFGPDALEAHGGAALEARSPAATPAQGSAHAPGSEGAAADAARWEAGLGGRPGSMAPSEAVRDQIAAGQVNGSGLGLGLAADATRVLAALSPAGVRRVLGAMVGRFPRSTAALLSGALPPAAAELLVARLEAADAELGAAGEQTTAVNMASCSGLHD